MNRDPGTRTFELFEQALTIAPEYRDAWLEAHCGSGSALLSRVTAMLAEYESASPFVLPSTEEARASRPLVAGRRLGPWEALRQIGEGGSASVYLGRRADGAFDKIVALKVFHRGRGASIVRFQQETAALSRFEHPNIARLLDAGETAEGIAWIAIEYAAGEPIDAYCETRDLPLRKRLGLMLQVCDAVAAAHRSLIVHRDLKPSNILVLPDGTPKLLDFGISRALAFQNAATQPTDRVMTLDYASPEQVTGLPITTATDVYSLGVVLYELLAGVRPFEKIDAPVYTLIDAITNETPSPPSDHAPIVSADLDAIVGRCLRKEPDSRYRSVDELRDDILRHLENRPVRARDGGALYHARCFLARHTAVSTLAVVLATSVVIGVGTTWWHARVSAQRFHHLRSLTTSVFRTLHNELHQLPGSFPAVLLVADKRVEYLEVLAASNPSLAPELLDALFTYIGVSGHPERRSMGHTERAEAAARRAVIVADQIFASRPASLPDREKAGFARTYRALLLIEMGRAKEAEALLRDALQLFRHNSPADRATPDDGAAWATAWQRLSTALAMLGRIPESDNAFATALQTQVERLEIARRDLILPDRQRVVRSVAITRYVRACDLIRQGRHADALPHASEALRLEREIAAESTSVSSDMWLARAHHAMAATLAGLGRKEEALKHADESIALLRKLVAADPGVPSYERLLANALVTRAQTVGAAAAPIARDAHATLARLSSRDPLNALLRQETAHAAEVSGSAGLQ